MFTVTWWFTITSNFLFMQPNFRLQSISFLSYFLRLAKIRIFASLCLGICGTSLAHNIKAMMTCLSPYYHIQLSAESSFILLNKARVYVNLMDLTKSHDINWRQPCNACGLQTFPFFGLISKFVYYLVDHSNCGKVIRGPLPTLFYRLEAAHLGHLLRRSVRLWLVRKNVLNRGSSHTFQGVKKGHRTRRRSPCSPRFLTASPRNASAAISKSLAAPSRLIRKDNSSCASRYRHVVHFNASPLRLGSLSLTRYSAGILTCFPFGWIRIQK